MTVWSEFYSRVSLTFKRERKGNSMATTPTGPSSRTQAIQNTDNSRCAAEFRRVTSLPMFSFGGRRQNGGHGKAPIQTQPPAPFEVTEGRHLPDGAAKASESAFAPLKIMLLCPVVMPARNSSPSASQASGLCVPALCSTVHLNMCWTRATDAFWLIFLGPLSLACFHQQTSSSRNREENPRLWLAANPPMPMTPRGPWCA